jgi:hypothetical protein
MATGRRCDIGCATWPDKPLYSRCPECGEQTRRFSNAKDDLLDDDEAERRLLHAEFERYYEKYDAQADSDRLDPVHLGDRYDPDDRSAHLQDSLRVTPAGRRA